MLEAENICEMLGWASVRAPHDLLPVFY
jgi:hypothetical protein